jgi:dTDP-4-dehydrorhamnose reductase
MNILLFGKGGQLGWELQRALAPLGALQALGTEDAGGDFRQPEAVAALVDRLRPDVVVNAAAYTAVDKAESDGATAQLVNAQTPAALSEAVRRCGALLVHYSTDYVFDGSGRLPRHEDHPAGPLNVYGQTKLEGEQAIAASGCQHLIFRTSWVYASRGQNFARTMLRLASQRDELKVVGDQIGAPTGADLLADVSAHAIRAARRDASLTGLYHLVAAGETSWYDYARFVIEGIRRRGGAIQVLPQNILPIATADYPTPARRPLNSRLATDKLRAAFDVTLPDWQVGVDRMLHEISGG